MRIVPTFKPLEDRHPGLSPTGEPASVEDFAFERGEEAGHTFRLPFFKRYRKTVLVGVVVCVTMALLLALELSLRMAGTPLLFSSDMAMKRAYFPDHEDIKLADPPQWVTDQHGIFVANPNVQQDANSAGYRTPELNGSNDERTKVLFLGDSFTWGWSASPIFRIFC